MEALAAHYGQETTFICPQSPMRMRCRDCGGLAEYQLATGAPVTANIYAASCAAGSLPATPRFIARLVRVGRSRQYPLSEDGSAQYAYSG